MAALSVGTLIVTGIFATGQEVSSLNAMVNSVYGQALILKIILFLAVGAVGLVNATMLHPTLTASLRGRCCSIGMKFPRFLGDLAATKPQKTIPLSLRSLRFLPVTTRLEALLGGGGYIGSGIDHQQSPG